MDKKLRDAQKNILALFSVHPGSFALAGGTALELYYLHHRFSADLDFFSSAYRQAEIEKIISHLEKGTAHKIKLQSELKMGGKARVRFYVYPVKGSARPLKLDFIEDVVVASARIRKFAGVPVYSAPDIYMHKIAALAGTRIEEDDVGRQVITGRAQARDAFDVYMLSKKIEPLHTFLKRVPHVFRIGMAHWYRTFSRQDLKLDLLDLDIYDADFSARKMIIYLESEIKKFIKEAVE